MSVDLRYVGDRNLLPKNSSLVFLNSLWPRWWTDVVNNKNVQIESMLLCDGAANVLQRSLQTVDLKNKTEKHKKNPQFTHVTFEGLKNKEIELVGDFDSVTDQSLDWISKRLAKRNVSLKVIPLRDQNFTDSDKALQYINSDGSKSTKGRFSDQKTKEGSNSFAEKIKNLAEQLDENEESLVSKEPPILLMGAFSGNRIDHMLNNVSVAAKFGSNVHLHGQNSTIVVLGKGKSKIQLPKNTANIGLFPICGSTVVKTEGLKWNLDNEALDFLSTVSCSNELDISAKDKTVIVETEKPTMIIVETQQNK